MCRPTQNEEVCQTKSIMSPPSTLKATSLSKPTLRKLAKPNRQYRKLYNPIKPITSDLNLLSPSSPCSPYVATPRRPQTIGYNPWNPILFLLHVIFVVVGLLFFVHDVMTFGFSSSNGRFISFLDSFDNCYSFRVQQPFQPLEEENSRMLGLRKKRSYYHIGSPVRSFRWKLRTLVLSFMFKYGSSTFVSLLLWTKPVFIKGPRHLVYFSLALVLIQFFPGDLPYRSMKQSYSMQLMIGLSVSFYKLRKLLFVVHVFDGRFTLVSWLLMSGLAIIAIDGDSLARAFENTITHRGVRTSSPDTLLSEVKLALAFFWSRNQGLLVCSTALFVTNSVCNLLSNTSLATMACDLHFITKVGGLFVFMERKGIWKAKSGESVLWKLKAQFEANQNN